MSVRPLDHGAVRRAFERAAPHYNDHAVLQREVEDRLLERLVFVRQKPRRILDLGCGPGRGAALLAEAFPEARVTGVDWSVGMLRQIPTPGQGHRPDALCADLARLPVAAARFDLVFSNLALQWSDDLPAAFAELRRVLRPGGMLLFSTFGPDTLFELREAWATVDDRPHVNGFLDMHDVGDAMVRAGFTEPVMDMDRITLKYASAPDVMRGLKHIGATNADPQRASGLTGRARLAAVSQAYEAFREGDRYPATFEVVYGTAFGPEEGQPVRTGRGEQASFSVDQLRASLRKKDPP